MTDTLEETGLESPLREVVTSVSDAVDDIVDETQMALDEIDPTNVTSVLQGAGHVASGVLQGVEEILTVDNRTKPVRTPIYMPYFLTDNMPFNYSPQSFFLVFTKIINFLNCHTQNLLFSS